MAKKKTDPYRIQIKLRNQSGVTVAFDEEKGRVIARHGDVLHVPKEVTEEDAHLLVGQKTAVRLTDGEEPEPIGSQRAPAKKRGRPKKSDEGATPDAD